MDACHACMQRTLSWLALRCCRVLDFLAATIAEHVYVRAYTLAVATPVQIIMHIIVQYNIFLLLAMQGTGMLGC